MEVPEVGMRLEALGKYAGLFLVLDHLNKDRCYNRSGPFDTSRLVLAALTGLMPAEVVDGLRFLSRLDLIAHDDDGDGTIRVAVVGDVCTRI